MANLNLNTVALVSTLRPAALNGAPSSEDYNDSQNEFLLDLISLSAFINNVLNPMLKALPDNAISGLEGSSIYGDSTDQTALFYDSLTQTPLSLSDSLRQLNAIVAANNLNVTNLGIQVGQLQQKLSSTNQNNIAITLQNLTNSLNTLTNQQTSQDAAITALQQVSNTNVQVTGGTIDGVLIGSNTPVQSITVAPAGIIIADTTNGHTYSITFVNGIITYTQVS